MRNARELRAGRALMYRFRMKVVVLLVAAPLLICGCYSAREVAVTSFRVIDAPAAYVRRHLDSDRSTTTTTTTTSSDTVTPGRPVDVVPVPQATPRRRPASERRSASTNRVPAKTATARSQSGASGTEASTRSTTPAARTTTKEQPQFPTAKPVPGKAGYVYSPYDPNSGYVDVTGYPSGSKAKDPYSQKIFIVP